MLPRRCPWARGLQTLERDVDPDEAPDGSLPERVFLWLIHTAPATAAAATGDSVACRPRAPEASGGGHLRFPPPASVNEGFTLKNFMRYAAIAFKSEVAHGKGGEGALGFSVEAAKATLIVTQRTSAGLPSRGEKLTVSP